MAGSAAAFARWCVLRAESLDYYKDNRLKGSISLGGAWAELKENHPSFHCFCLHSESREFYAAADTAEERDRCARGEVLSKVAGVKG